MRVRRLCISLIRTTLAAVPRRLPVLWGKAMLVTVATLAVSLPAAFVAFVAGQSILARAHLSVPLSDPGVVRAVIGGALYLAVAALIGLGLGGLLRSTAGGIAALFGLLFGLQLAAGFLPAIQLLDLQSPVDRGRVWGLTSRAGPGILASTLGAAAICRRSWPN